MKFVEEFIADIKQNKPYLFIILSIFVGSVGLIKSILDFKGINLFISAISIVFIFIYFVKIYNYRMQTVIFFRSRNDVPEKFTHNAILKNISTKKCELIVLGRSCFSWICGNEDDFKNNFIKYEQDHIEIKNKILSALKNGITIHFIIQNPYEPIYDLGFSSITINSEKYKKNEQLIELLRLRSHVEEAIKKYKEISTEFKTCANYSSTSFKLSVYSGPPARNGMLRLKMEGNDTRFHVDLSTEFEDIDRGKSKPILLFIRRQFKSAEFEYLTKPFREIFNGILNSCITLESFEQKREEASRAIKKVKDENYPLHSKLRNNNSDFIIALAAKFYVAEHSVPPWHGIQIPPKCIQLLVTNHCTTQCKMCDHFKLFDSENELKTLEVERILESIRSLKTKAIIISGGEPLARNDIFDILKYAKNNCQLQIGLLTNGLRLDNDNRTRALTPDEAEIIVQTCEWVQLSIDSFDSSTYAQIRNNGSYEAVKETINMLSCRGLKNLEVCFTIQNRNVNEIINGKEIFKTVSKWLPKPYMVRFKIAHGPRNTREEFLCGSNILQRAVQAGAALAKEYENRFDFHYIEMMIQNRLFDYNGLSEGMPVKSAIERLKGKEYICAALKMTCKIDASGDVFPCCFLFDDNNGVTSQIRGNYKLGSLRQQETNTVPDPSTDNILEKIWYSNTMLKAFQSRSLPVDPEACCYCTRHFHQNLLINELFKVFKEFSESRLAEDWAGRPEADQPFWL